MTNVIDSSFGYCWAYDPSQDDYLLNAPSTHRRHGSSHQRSQMGQQQEFSKCFDSQFSALNDSSIWQSQSRSHKSHKNRYGVGTFAPSSVPKFSRRVSQLTLAQASQAGVETGHQVWRDENLFSALKKKKKEAHEFAAWQDDCRKTHAAHDRFRANWWRRWRNSQSHTLHTPDGTSPVPADDPQNAGASSTSTRMTWAGQMLEMVAMHFGGKESPEASATVEAIQTDTSPAISKHSHGSVEDSNRKELDTDVTESVTKALSNKDPKSRKTTNVKINSDGTGQRKSILGSVKKRMSVAVPNRGRPTKSISDRKSRKQDSGAPVDRITALMAARRDEFDCLPVQERDMLRQAFVRCDIDGSGTLDPKEIRKSLKELGIFGRTPAEKKIVTEICRDAVTIGNVNFFDFVFQIVPFAKAELTKIRRVALRERFEKYDLDKSGLLSLQECRAIVMEICATGMDATSKGTFHKDFPTLFAQCQLSGSEEIDFEGFVILLQLLETHHAQIIADRENHIAQYWRLPQSLIMEHRGELVSLFEWFENADADGSGSLEHQEVVTLMLEMGISRNDGDGREIIDEALQKFQIKNSIGFPEFLDLVKGVRRGTASVSRDKARQLFEKYDTDNSGLISFKEASIMIAESGMGINIIKDKESVRKVFEEVDQDGSGEIDEREFYSLFLKVMERLRTAIFQKERDVCQRLGYSVAQVEELRVVFQTLDEQGHGEIGVEELQRVPRLLGYEVGDVGLILGQLTSGRFNGSVDFTLFMKFMSTYSEQLKLQK